LNAPDSDLTKAAEEPTGAQDGSSGLRGDLPGAAGSALGEAERKRILYDWNDTRAHYPDVCVHQLFEQQVARTPDAVALVFGAQKLTYRELNRRANQVGHFLRKNGVGPEALVGVCLRRSPELVIGLLGVWKAGGAYVPLDPAYPPERLSFMVGDAGIRILLTEQACKNLLSFSGDMAVCLDSDWSRIAEEGIDNPGVAALPSNVAYCMYTSGSTGAPKGAMILHAGLVNYLLWAIETYAVEANASVPVHSSIAFDLTVTSLYPALLAGGQVELLTEDVGAQNLLAALRRRKNFSLVKITPAHLDVLTQQLRPEELAGLTKAFVIGGENLSAESLSLWRDFAPDSRLINEYGPTETVVGCCTYEIKADDPPNGPVPIGRPIANTQLYVLDPDRQPVPPGVMGELYIGGAGVARGYLNRPDLTEQRFLPDPFSGRDGARLYRTGDLARYRADGTLEYLGRIDNQVKLRGYRIELGEIEATLAGHPATHSCAVLAREDIPGSKQLVAYLVAREGQQAAVDDLVAFLKRQLPDYMVPAHFVFLASLPLTLNGKVDRNALPPPSEANVSAAGNFVAPRDEMERSIAAIWADALNLKTISVDADFFQLGGQSLLAIRVLATIHDRLGVDLPPQTFFEHSTVAALAALVRQAAEVRKDAGAGHDAGGRDERPVVNGAPQAALSPTTRSFRALVPIKKHGAGIPFFCVHGAGGNVLNFYDLSRAMPPDRAFFGLQAYGVDGITRPHATIEDMAEAYLLEVREVQPHGPYLLGGYSGGGIVAFEMARRLTEAGEEVGLLALLETFHPYVKMRLTLADRVATMRKERLGYLKRFANRPAAIVRQWWERHRIEECLRSAKTVPLALRSNHLMMNFGAATARYRPSPWTGRATLFRAKTPDDFYRHVGPRYGWEEHVLGGVDLEFVPGDHNTLVLDANAVAFVRSLNAAIQRATDKSPAIAVPTP
jgi:amino acid adenylation domain-containing protein